MPIIEFENPTRVEVGARIEISDDASIPPPQSRRPSYETLEALPHPRVRDKDPEPFILALGL